MIYNHVPLLMAAPVVLWWEEVLIQQYLNWIQFNHKHKTV